MPRLKKLRSDRMAAAIVAASLLLATVVYYIIQRGKLGDTRLATDKTLLAALAAVIMVLALGLGWMTVRNMARVLADRRAGIAGVNLQARIALYFLVLVLVPTIVLFGAAIATVKQTIEQIAAPDPDDALRSAAKIPSWVYADQAQRASVVAGLVLDDLRAGALADRPWPPRGELAATLDRAMRRHGVDAIGVIAPGETPFAVAATQGGSGPAPRSSELMRVPGALSAAGLRGETPAVHLERMAVGWRAVALEPLVVDGEVQAAVWVGVYLPERIADLLGRLESADSDLREVQQRELPVRRLYYALFALVTLLVLFASVWAGFFLARQVTRPVQELARGTEALAQGDLSFRVREPGNDEIGHLAASFNHMAEEIQRHRRDLVTRRRYIETLLEAVPVGVISLDEAGRVSTANRAAGDLLRLPQGALQGPLEKALGEGRGSLLAAARAVASGEQDRLTREIHVSTDEGEVALEMRAARFALPARGHGVLIVLEDLTQLRRAERVAAWGEVARRVAHEIKNPLTPIRLAAERMVRRYREDAGEAGPAIEDGVATIVREVESLRNLVGEFSKFARMPKIKLVDGSVNDVAREAVELYRSAHAAAEIECQLEEGLPPHRIDPEALRRCLINLVENAVAAAGESGEIIVRSSSGAGGASVVLEVLDDGPGIPEADRAQLFLPSFSRRPGGTGLGLAIVAQAVAEHGGRVRCADNPSGGTRIIIELPSTGGRPFDDEEHVDGAGEEAPSPSTTETE